MTTRPPEPTPPQRVRVTGPPRRSGTRAVPRSREIDEETRLGEIYMESLLREQGRLAVVVLVVLFGGLGSLPLVFHLWPHLAEVRALGMPLPWLALGFLVYPALWVVGWGYVRAAERNERDFTHLVATGEEEP